MKKRNLFSATLFVLAFASAAYAEEASSNVVFTCTADAATTPDFKIDLKVSQNNSARYLTPALFADLKVASTKDASRGETSVSGQRISEKPPMSAEGGSYQYSSLAAPLSTDSFSVTIGYESPAVDGSFRGNLVVRRFLMDRLALKCVKAK